jgi:hypothetical protein
MSYRGQFAYPTPPGCRDEDFVYSFDGSNVPMLGQNIATRTIENIPLPLDQDAPFYWRAIKVGLFLNITFGESTITQYRTPNLSLWMKDCYENHLSDGYIPAPQYGFAQNPISFNGQLLTGPPMPLESEIYCPRGGVLWLNVKDNSIFTGSTGYYNFLLTLWGVKRFKDCA